ncbi:hypothetical protein PV325_002904 [Microctonus aethiopoides]|nr:hypothetical protein PV325_002904 [Microctonus aethiopoides]KAK0096910.1 hypothetical protein PV326_003931 [Microctonus aethiopoides]
MTGKFKHRPGALKQTNKAHKTGRHRSKGAINLAAKGKTNVKEVTRQTKKELSKEVRRNQCQQLRKKKRDEVIALKRNFGSSLAPPILITVIPLHQDISTQSIVSMLTDADEAAAVISNNQGVTHISIPRFKQRYSIIVPPIGNTFATLDAAKVSSTILFAMSPVDVSYISSQHNLIDSWGEEIMEACISQGLPSTVVALTNLKSVNIKKHHELKQVSQSLINKWLPEEKILPLNNAADALNLLRKVGSQKQRKVAFRDKRPYLLAEDVEFSSGENQIGTLKISGYLRGVPLSVNSIIHMPGFGDFQLSQIDASNDPYPITNSDSSKGINIDGQVRILEKADPQKQESLESENIPDPMDAEQTWPTDEEIASAEAEHLKKKTVKLVPKGTSEYQAAWIVDDNDELSNDDYSDSEDDGSDDEKMSIAQAQSDVENSDKEGMDDNEEYETLTVSEAPNDDNRYDDQMDIYEELESMKKLKDAKLDAHFPDEMDTPQDISARIRFQKYRGLESFRTSPWDPQENLPYDYSRIFQFENFDRTRKRVFKESEDIEGAMPGWYITLHIKNVNEEHFKCFKKLEDAPLIVIGLLANEHKMSLLNVLLKRKADIDAQPIKSKERLIFQCGFRRFSACPIFSEHTNGSKHKYARFFQPNDTVVASMYAPITFPPCRVMCYKKQNYGIMELVASGNVLSADPNRLVIKRVILSGHPFKVNKRSAVIRFMFFNREDILWFKSVQLHTKYGRRGHIREPLGTHGHMKCVFDGQLKSQDTVLMNLYKRVFPKWTYEPYLLTSE